MHGARSAQEFNNQNVYPCPACRLGQIQTMPLMETMACSACKHIFTINIYRNRLLMVDCSPVLIWHWNGKNWTGAPVEGIKLGQGYWLSALAFVLFPPALIGLSTYFLIPTSDISPSWIAIGWTGLTFLVHLILVGRLVLGFYRFPIGIYFSVVRRQLFNH